MKAHPRDDYVEVPKGNDRMWSVALVNLRRGRRVRKGTATVYRLMVLIQSIRARHPNAWKASPKPDAPMIICARRFGPVVLTVEALHGPVASVATKH